MFPRAKAIVQEQFRLYVRTFLNLAHSDTILNKCEKVSFHSRPWSRHYFYINLLRRPARFKHFGDAMSFGGLAPQNTHINTLEDLKVARMGHLALENTILACLLNHVAIEQTFSTYELQISARFTLPHARDPKRHSMKRRSEKKAEG